MQARASSIRETAAATTVYRSELTAQDIVDVASGRALAIVIAGYYSAADCLELSGRLKSAAFWTTYAKGTGAEHIGTLGKALYGCLGDEMSDSCERYFASAPQRNRDLRRAVHPYLLPADRVQIELDQIWPFGARLLRVGGRPAFLGLCRIVRSGGGIEPHTDRADWDVPRPETSNIRAQMFMNVYLSQAERGGELELWDFDVPTKADYDALRSRTTYYALDRAQLPPPTVRISIEPGSLVIANASRPHAVAACEGLGERLSVSGFFAYDGDDRSLRLFS